MPTPFAHQVAEQEEVVGGEARADDDQPLRQGPDPAALTAEEEMEIAEGLTRSVDLVQWRWSHARGTHR